MNPENIDIPLKEDIVAEQSSTPAPALSSLLDPATEKGLTELLLKVAPLIQGKRFDNVVDLLSLVSDGVDMVDDAMVQKLMKGYEELVGAAWSLGNAARFAAAQTAVASPPGLFGLLRMAGQEDVRRGLTFALHFLSVIGRQMQPEVQGEG